MPKVRMVTTSDTGNTINKEYPGAVFVVIGPLASFSGDGDLIDALEKIVRLHNSQNKHLLKPV